MVLGSGAVRPSQGVGDSLQYLPAILREGLTRAGLLRKKLGRWLTMSCLCREAAWSCQLG